MAHSTSGTGGCSTDVNAAAILVDPHPRGHIVYPYTHENLVRHAVHLYASAGLSNGEGVILIMANKHYASIIQRLQLKRFDTEHLQRQGRLACAIAEDLLAAFMVSRRRSCSLNVSHSVAFHVRLVCKPRTSRALARFRHAPGSRFQVCKSP